MKTMQEVAQAIDDNREKTITEAAAYNEVVNKLLEAKEAGKPLDEGILGAITGGILGATIGPSITRALCKILGVDERGQFGSLLTSRMVTTALGAAMGWK